MSLSRASTFLTALAVAAGLAAPPEARAAAPAPIKHPAQVFSPIKVDVSPPLRTIKPITTVPPGAKAPENPPIPKPGRKLGPTKAAADAALQVKPGLTPMPAPLLDFEGLPNDFGVLPPDTQGDVGPNHYIQWVNLGFVIFDKTGAQVYPPLPTAYALGNTLWTGFGGACESSNDGDIQTNYDPLADRWVMSQFALPNPFYQCLAISATPDPLGAWYRYQFSFGSTLNDYPKIGVWPDGYYMTVNQFLNGGASWGGLGVVVFQRDQMLAGNPALAVYFDVGAVNLNYGGDLPADLKGPPPPPGTPGYVIEWDQAGWIGDTNNTLRIWEVHVDWTNPSNSTFGLNPSYDPNFMITTAAGTVPACPGGRSCVPQPGTSQGLDAIADRMMQRLQYRNIGGVGRLTVNHTLDTGDGRAGVRWYQLQNPGSGWTMLDQGTFGGDPGDTDWRWMGSAALDTQGNMAIGYSVSSSTTYPSIRFNGRLAGDPAGTLGTEANIIVGGGSQTHPAARWGDYSAMVVDPTDDCTFWYTTEYYQTTSSANWQTRIASFKFPGCTTGPHGTIDGTVKSTAGGTPIAGALVQIGPSYSTTTNGAGFFTVSVPTGTYDVTASKFGYAPATVPGQVVTDGGTTHVGDILLTPVGTYTVDGFVTAADHGWPLWARIDISQSGNPVNTIYTSPWNGYYNVILPNGYTYDFNVQSMYQGYQNEVRPVTLSSGDQIQSFTLLASSGNPAYSCYLNGGVNENFDGSFPPLGWTVLNNGSVPNNVWKRNDAWGRPNLTGGTGFSSDADSDAAGSGSGPFNTELWSPPIMMPATPRNLRFKSAFRRLSTDTGTLDVSTNGGGTWTNLLTFTVTGVSEPTVDMTAYAGQMIVLRWKYTSGSWEYYWQIDDVRTETIVPPPPPPVSQWIQNFDGVTAPALPADWAQATLVGSGTWTNSTASSHPSGITPHSSPNMPIFNSWSVSSGNSALLYKLTSENLSSGTGYVRFWMYHDTGYTNADTVQVAYSTDGSSYFLIGSQIPRYTGGTGWAQHEVILTGVSNATVFIALYGLSGFGNDIHVDDVEFLVGAAPTPPVADSPTLLCNAVPGTLVAGFVTDANTAAGIPGALILRDLGGMANSMPATGDQPAGFYYMFSATPAPTKPNGPSTRTFTASKQGYGPVSHSVNLVPDTINRLDFALPAASLTLGGWPFNVDGRLTPDGMPAWDKTQVIPILNSGGLPANVKLNLGTVGPGWTPPRMFPAAVREPASPTPVKKSFMRDPNAPTLPNAGRIRYPGLGGPLAGIPAFGVDLFPGGNFVTWPDAAVPGTWSVIAPVPGSSAYFGGDFLGGDFSKEYVVDDTTKQLLTLNTTTGAATVIGSMVPNAGESWTGLKGSSADGNVYASATNCSSSTFYTIDPTTGHATAVGPITNGACVIDIAINDAGDIYGIDIVTSNLLKINPATGAGTVVGPLGVPTNYAQGMAFERVSGVLYWAAYATSGELRTIDTATGASFLVGPFPGGAEVDAFAIASGGGANIPWITLTPNQGVVPPTGELDVLAEFFPDGVPAANFGLNRAIIRPINDSPGSLPNMDVFFTKAFWDVPRGSFADAFIHGLAGARVTKGCGSGNYCPNDPITRADMAVLMVRATHGPDFTPPPAVGIFADVVISDSNNTADYIEQLVADGVVGGCAVGPPRLYCPNDLVNRAQMSVFISAGIMLPPVSPPTGYFTDMAGYHWADGFAEAIFNAGITAGCGPHIFCPSMNITRAQLAVWLVTGLGIPFYTHPAGP